jgi:opacity protein-like surface antigen
MSRNWWKILTALIFTGMHVGQLHAADGLYLGAGIGVASFRDDLGSGVTFDEDDAAYKAIIGWRFDFVPVIDLAIEAAYTDFGKPSQTVAAQQSEVNLRGPSIAGLAILPLGPVDLYAKLGVLDWKLERTIAGTKQTSSGNDAFYGAGIGFYIWKLAFRAEYERFQIQDVDRVEMVSVHALFQF